MKYSSSTRGFYLGSIHGTAIPDDAVDVPDERYSELMVAQESGYVIVPNPDGYPVATLPPSPSDIELAEAARSARAAAFAKESDPLFFKWQRGEATEADWRGKCAEIRARYPAPESVKS
ncbi:hypothetical protein [Azonexus sp.]|uniref:hypothetical protein n=1 Tax=Azonexus sp. TaxID=1872668 RepID=UPI0035B35B5C